MTKVDNNVAGVDENVIEEQNNVEKVCENVIEEQNNATLTVKPIKNANQKFKKNLFYFSVVALPILQFIIFYIVVNFRSILFAFQSYDAAAAEYSFIGLANFKKFFSAFKSEPKMVYSLKNSAILFALTLVIGTGGAVIFSNYIYKKYFMSKFFRITLFLPTIISGIVLVTAYKFLIDQGVPVIAEKIWGKEIEPPLSQIDLKFTLVLVFALWFGFGTQVLMYTSSMSGISPEIVESAELDGITPVKELFYITLPLIYSVFITFVTIGVAGFFTNSMMLYSFYGDTVDPQLYTFGYFLYRDTQVASTLLDYDAFCYLSAAGLIMTAVAVPFTIGIKKFMEKAGPSEE